LGQNLYIISSPEKYSGKEKIYFEVRRAEGRILTDKEVLKLPDTDKNNPHSEEWKIRRDSCRKLLNYISKKNPSPRILEIGCGNGWLSAQLAGINNSKVDSIDINSAELEQAARVFNKENLTFYYRDISKDIITDSSYDIILLAASVQYFPSLPELLGNLLPLLKNKGEIHIIDSPFYTKNTLENARQRSYEYYAGKGFSAMADYYFHHSMNDLKGYNYSYLNRFPGYRFVSLLNPKSYLYFPWIKICQQKPQQQ